jgi:hypothetical protein
MNDNLPNLHPLEPKGQPCDGEAASCGHVRWARAGRICRLIAHATGTTLLLRLWSKRGRRGLPRPLRNVQRGRRRDPLRQSLDCFRSGLHQVRKAGEVITRPALGASTSRRSASVLGAALAAGKCRALRSVRAWPCGRAELPDDRGWFAPSRHAIVGYDEHTHVGHLTTEKGYVKRALVYATDIEVIAAQWKKNAPTSGMDLS